jgi:hypothetical protein
MHFSPSASARPVNVAGLGLSIPRIFNFERQSVAFPEIAWIDPRCLKPSDMQKHVRATGAVCDEALAAIGIPQF